MAIDINSPTYSPLPVVNTGETAVIEAPSGNDNSAGLQEPNQAADVQNYLNSVQQKYFAQESAAESSDSVFSNTGTDPNANSTNPETNPDGPQLDLSKVTSPAPQAPKLVDTYKEMKAEYGINDLEKSVSELNKLRMDTEARLRQRNSMERNKTVAMNVIQGRQSEVETQERENLDYIDRQISYKTAQLTNANSVISTLMSLTNTDYQNSLASYEAQYKQIMEVHNILRSEFESNRSYEEMVRENQRQSALANLQIIMNSIEKGMGTMAKYSDEQKIAIARMETQAGLPTGFMANLQMPPGSNIKSTTNRTGGDGYDYLDILYVTADGKVTVESKRLGKTYVAPKQTTNTYTDKYSNSDLQKAMGTVAEIDFNDDGLLSKEEIEKAVRLLGQDLAYRAISDGGYKLWTPASQNNGQSSKTNSNGSVTATIGNRKITTTTF